MTLKKPGAVAAALALAAALVACGGGGGSDAPSDSPLSKFVDTYGGSLATTNTASGLTGTELKNAFDDKYLDGGITKAAVLAALQADASAMGADATFSAFPQLTLSDAALTDCGADGICTLTGTFTNNDADATAVPFSVRVVQSGGVLKLYGDQQTS